MITGRQLSSRVDQLDDATVAELYSMLWQRAIENNPLKEWTLKLNPTREDLKEVLSVLPPRDCQDLSDLYFR